MFPRAHACRSIGIAAVFKSAGAGAQTLTRVVFAASVDLSCAVFTGGLGLGLATMKDNRRM